MEAIEKELRNALNKIIDITIVHHVEGITRITTGTLLEVTDELIRMKLEWKRHFWSRTNDTAVYICNRKAASILSLCVRETETNRRKSPAMDLIGK